LQARTLRAGARAMAGRQSILKSKIQNANNFELKVLDFVWHWDF
jgi:hypothetical protein